MASIQKKNNKYCVVYYCKDIEGKRKQKWETYDTKNEAKIRKAEIELKEKREYENYKRRCLAEADHSQEKKRLEYLTVPEAAELAGVEPATIAFWYTTGKIPIRKTGKIIRIPREAFRQWLLKRKEKGVV